MRKLNDEILNPKHWYIMVFIKGKPVLYSRFFKTREKAENFMYINKIKGLQYTPIKGEKAIDYELKFHKGRVNRLFKNIDSYDYPVDRISKQDRKSFRTKSRRWMRDFKTLPNNHTDFKSFKKS